MNVHKIWLLLLFLLIPTILFAQKTRTVKGLVCTTSETKKGEEPLPYASLVILEGKTLLEISQFVSDKLSPIDEVVGTATHFILKKYKDHGTIFDKKGKADRMLVTP